MVSVTDRSSPRGFTISWVELTCGEVNDAQVNGYIVRYGLFSETQRVTTLLISGSTHTISDPNLQVFVEYSVEVAAVNSMGAGQFSPPETVVIPGSKIVVIFFYKRTCQNLFFVFSSRTSE